MKKLACESTGSGVLEVTYLDGPIHEQLLKVIAIDPGRTHNENIDKSFQEPSINVTINSRFGITDTVITKGQRRRVMQESEGAGSGSMPQVNVTSQEIIKFIDILNELSENKFRLPSVEERLFAANGGKCCQGFLYAGSDAAGQVGRSSVTSTGELKGVKLLLPNELDIYDMSGNVWEICESGEGYVLKGGSFRSPELDLRKTVSRELSKASSDEIGFRLVMELSET